ncbi:hypothetical protein Trydic_g6580 [Trypoxylus dichotomus]
MDSEELYDSLDEDVCADTSKKVSKRQLKATNSSHSDNITVLFERGFRPTSSDSESFDDTWLTFSRCETRRPQPKTATPKQKDVKQQKICAKDVENAEKSVAEYDLSEVIPLYDREMPKRSLKDVRKELQQDKKQTKCAKFKKSGIQNAGNPLVNLKEQRTYSNIFYARMGRQILDKNKLTESARAQYGDETNRSNVSEVSSHFSDAKSSVSEGTSFYMDLLNTNQTTSSGDTITPSSNKSEKKLESESLYESEFNFKSISQCFEQNKSISNVKIGGNRKAKSKLCLVTPPVLGSLGPDMEAIQDKLSLLKKRRSYGQRVSDRNRIKMKEMQVLKDLTEEIRKARL